MNNDLQTAIHLLKSGRHTCVLCRGEETYSSDLRGVAPLLDFLSAGLDASGFSAADKVVGKATAMLYCLLGVSRVYAPILSAPARSVLEAHGIQPLYDTLVPGILNRTRTGPCPMESAVQQIWDLQEGLAAILQTRQLLQSQKS